MNDWYGRLADLVVVVHAAFVCFVVAGGILVLRWPRLAWLHLPSAAWGAWIELSGWICPLTPLEVRLRQAAGEAGYAGGFIEHYLEPILYPVGMQRGVQILLAAVVIGVNALIYFRLYRRSASRPFRGP
jgi:hypothetical protein